MLNKQACKKCWNNYATNNNVVVMWNDDDEKRWSDGYVFCYMVLGIQHIDGECDSNCPYILEHLMEECK